MRRTPGSSARSSRGWSERVLLAVLLTLTLFAVGPLRPAEAAEVTPGLRLSDTVAVPGARLIASGTGFVAGEQIDLYVGTSLASAISFITATSAGSFTDIGLIVPTDTPPGPVPVVANGRYSHFTASAALTVRSSWAQLGGGPGHSGYNPTENVLDASNIAGLTKDWRSNVGIAAAPPTVAYGLVYETENDGVFAVSEADGTRVWDSSHGGSSLSSLTIAVGGGLLFFWTHSGIRALDAHTGKIRWTVTDLVDPSRPVSAPVYADGLLLLSFGSGSKVVALDASTGAIRWSRSATTVTAAPAVANGLMYVQLTSGVVALDETTGVTRWTRALTGLSPASLAVRGDTLVVAGSSGTTALDALTGAVLWTDARTVTGDAALAGGRAYLDVQTASGGHQVVAVALRTGAPAWVTAAGVGTPVVANGLVYLASGQWVTVLDAATGKQVKQIAYGRAQTAGVVVANGGAYVAVRLDNAAGGVDAWVVDRLSVPVAKIPTVTTLDDVGTGPNQLAYSGGWAVDHARAGAYQNTLHYTSNAGSIASVTYPGTGVRLWYSSAPNYGKLDVFLDGGLVKVVDESSGVRRDGVKSVTLDLPVYRTYRLVVVREGSVPLVTLDRIDLGTR